MTDDGFEFNPWAFLFGALIAANLYSHHRAQSAEAADSAVLREARAIHGVHQHYGYITPEQAQTLYRAGEIEAKVDAWRRRNDSNLWRTAVTAAAWVVALAAVLFLANIGINGLVCWVIGIGLGVAAFRRMEAWRQVEVRSRPEVTGPHVHGGQGRHSHPHTRRHRHYGELGGPMY